VVNIGMFGRDLFDPDVIAYAMGGIIGVTFYGGVISFLPALVIVVAAEIFRWRSLLFWLAAGGIVGVIASEVTRSWDGLNFVDNLFTLCLAAGFVGGFVYWLIAGRDSGPAIAAASTSGVR
jgi:hypothetical protein